MQDFTSEEVASPMFSVIDPEGHHLTIAETVQAVVRAVRLGQHGRYQVDELGVECTSPSRNSRNWGSVIKFPSGDVAIHPRLSTTASDR